MSCIIEGCCTPTYSRGWCKKHYRRWQRHGDPITFIGSGGHPKHGHNIKGHRTPEYMAWDNMLRRCYNSQHPSFKNYGARGIGVCKAWQASFETFLQDVGLRPTSQHTLERRNNNRNYEPKNVYWATRAEQNRNKRTNRLITANGTTRCVADWATSELSANTIDSRLRSGWSEECAVLTPRLSQGARK